MTFNFNKRRKRPAAPPPPALVTVNVPCEKCGFRMPSTLHPGLNEKQLTCPQCATVHSLLVKSDGHGNAIVFKGKVEMWIPDDPGPAVK